MGAASSSTAATGCTAGGVAAGCGAAVRSHSSAINTPRTRSIGGDKQARDEGLEGPQDQHAHVLPTLIVIVTGGPRSVGGWPRVGTSDRRRGTRSRCAARRRRGLVVVT